MKAVPIDNLKVKMTTKVLQKVCKTPQPFFNIIQTPLTEFFFKNNPFLQERKKKITSVELS